MKLVDYLRLIRERIVVVLAIVVAAAGGSLAINLAQEPVYVANVRLRARPPAPGSTASDLIKATAEQTDLGTEAELVRSSAVAARVAKRLRIAGPPEGLLDHVQVGALPNTAVLVVQATATTPRLAVDLANAFAREYLAERRASLTASLEAASDIQRQKLQNAQARLQQLEDSLANLAPDSAAAAAVRIERDQTLAELVVIRSQLDALADRAAIAVGFGEIIQPATSARTERGTSPQRAVVFGVLIGVPLALAVVLLLDALSTTVRTGTDAARVTRADLLGLIPIDDRWSDRREPRLATISDPFSAVAEGYRTLSHNLSRAAAATSARTICITSPGAGEGKSATAVNLAVAYADGGRHVALVEADLRHPRAHAFLGLAPEPGVTDVLAGLATVPEVVQRAGPNLAFVASGRASERPDLLMMRADMAAFCQAVLAVTNGRPARAGGHKPASIAPPLALFDTSALLEAAEVSTVAATADCVLLVLRAGVTTRQAAARAADQVRRAGGRLLGVVLVGARSPADLGPLEEEKAGTPDAASRPQAV